MDNFKPYYSLIVRYANGKITRERFLLEWKILQRIACMGITVRSLSD